MNFSLKVIKYYLNFLTIFNSKYAGRIAVKLFQKIRIRKVKPKEEEFYEKAKKFTIKNSNSVCYELGNPKGKLVFLVHGWDSNAGSLSRFAFELATKNYRVISLDLPSHAYSKGTHTNLFECKDAVIKLINHINPKEPFDIFGHSFGAAVSVYSLSELNYSVNNIVLLSANNKMKQIFRDFQKMIGFNDKVYDQVAYWVKSIVHIDLENLILTDFIKKVAYKNLLVIHDKFDKILPFISALEIKEAFPETTLLSYEKIGHYRMLWNDDVVKKSIQFIE